MAINGNSRAVQLLFSHRAAGHSYRRVPRIRFLVFPLLVSLSLPESHALSLSAPTQVRRSICAARRGRLNQDPSPGPYEAATPVLAPLLPGLGAYSPQQPAMERNGPHQPETVSPTPPPHDRRAATKRVYGLHPPSSPSTRRTCAATTRTRISTTLAYLLQ